MDHLKLLEEEFIQDAAEADWERNYLKPTGQVGRRSSLGGNSILPKVSKYIAVLAPCTL